MQQWHEDFPGVAEEPFLVDAANFQEPEPKPGPQPARKRLGFTMGEFRKENLSVAREIILGLHSGEHGMLVARSNVGKSTLVRNVALCLAEGLECPPLVPAGPPRRVILLDGETHPDRLRRDLELMISALPDSARRLIDENLQVVHRGTRIDGKPLKLTTPEGYGQLEQEIKAFGAEFVAIDTRSAYFRLKDENGNSEVRDQVAEQMMLLAEDTQAALLILHHTGKVREGGRAANKLDWSRGASSETDATPVVYVLDGDPRHPGTATLHGAKVKGRDGELKDIKLKVDEFRWMRVQEIAPASSTTAYQAIEELFCHRSQWTTKEITQELGLKDDARNKALQKLVKDGKIQQTKKGNYEAAIL